MSPSDWAAWVQAVGSIGAIIAGFRVANKQIKSAAAQARLDRIETDDDRLTAALSVAMYTADLIYEAAEQATSPGTVTGYLEVGCYYLDFEGAARALQAIPLHDLRSSAMVGGLLKIQRCVESLDRMTNNAQADPLFEEHDYNEWQGGIVAIRNATVGAMESLAEQVEQGRARLREHM